MTCIYCDKSADSKEHWIPRWLGTYRGADTLLDRLCGACNKRLGDALDAAMARTGPEAIERYRRGMKGRHDRRVNPFRFKTQGATPPTIFTSESPGFEAKLLMEDKAASGIPNPVPIPQVLVRDGDGKQHSVPLPPEGLEDERAGPWLKKAIEERGLAGCRIDGLICETADTVIGDINVGGELPMWIRKALLHVFPNPGGFQHYTPTGGQPTSNHVEVQIEISVDYARAVAKLAFHYVLKQLPKLDGRAPAFDPLRRFIFEGEGDHKAFVDFTPPSFLIGRGERPADGHFLLLTTSHETIKVFIASFVHSPYSPPAMSVALGPPPGEMAKRPVMGHQLRLFDEGPEDGYDGQLVSVKTLYLLGRWGVMV